MRPASPLLHHPAPVRLMAWPTTLALTLTLALALLIPPTPTHPQPLAHASTGAGEVAQDGHKAQGTRFLRQPDVSATHIVFTHANDLWKVARDGGDAIRLTSSEGAETDAAFSPDGRWIAFTAQYDGNTDVYLIPATGGDPVRLTWHPSQDVSQGWTPDGDILFRSGRDGVPTQLWKFYTVSPSGGLPTPLALPQAYLGGMSADGARIAYQEIGYWDPGWRNYRGGQAQPIGIVSTSTWERTTPPGRASARWTRSGWTAWSTTCPSATGPSNVWSFDPRTGAERQVTRHADFDVMSLGAGDGVVVYEQAGYLHEVDPATGSRAPARHQRRRRHELGPAALGGRCRRPAARRPPVAHRQARALRMARRAVQRARRGGLLAQPDPQLPGWPTVTRCGRRTGRASPGSTTTATSTRW